MDYVDYKIENPWPDMIEGASIQWVETTSDNNWGPNWFSNQPGLESPGSNNVVMVGMPTALSPSDVLLYPNPTHDHFSLLLRGQEGENFRMEVYSALGTLLLSGDQGVVTQKLHRVENGVSDWPRGIYWVRIFVGDEVWANKLVVE